MGTAYYDLKRGETRPTEAFFYNEFLKARVDSGQASSRGYNPDKEGHLPNDMLLEDDVNVYVIHGLSSLFDKSTLKFMKRFVVSTSVEFKQGAKLRDKRERYWFHKINADFLLFQLGLFGQNPSMVLPERMYIERGQRNYAAAAACRQALDGGNITAVTEVLQKLTANFPRYVSILQEMRRLDPYHFGMGEHMRDRSIKVLEVQLAREREEEIGSLEHMLTLPTKES